MFSILITHRFFQIHPFITEIKYKIPLNLSWNRCGIQIDNTQFLCAISAKFSLLLKFYEYITLNLHAIQRKSTVISDWIHTDSLCCLHVFILWWNFTKITVRIQHLIFVKFLLITCRFNVTFSLYFHWSENFREIAH